MAGSAPGTFRGFEFPPGLIGHNQPPGIGVRRVMSIDNPNMVADQVERDRGVYARPPVKPVQYSPGNIKTSDYNPGLAGYNQHGHTLPLKAADMSEEPLTIKQPLSNVYAYNKAYLHLTSTS